MEVGKMFVRLGLEMSEFSKGLQDARSTLDRQARDFGSIGLGLSMAFTAPLAAVAKYSIEAAAGFEQSMNKIKALTKDFSQTSSAYLLSFEKDMGNLSLMALDLGKKTQYSAKQVADAMVEMAAAGFNATNIMKGMEGVLSLASVGQLKLADAAQISSSILQGFGLNASAMGRVADQLAKAASMSAVSVQDLGYSFKYVGPVAKAAGLNLAEVNAALVVLGNAGIKGEQGGTAIRNMIADLLKPSAQAAELMQKLGIQVTDAAGKMKPLADVIDELKNKNLSLTQGFQIFGVRFSEVLPLLQKGGDELRKITQEVENSAGSAKKMADVMRKGVAGMWEEFTGSIETLGISIGGALQPVVEPLLKSLTNMANTAVELAEKFRQLPVGIQAIAGGLIGLVAAVGPVALAFSGLATAMSSVAGLATGVATAFSSMASAGVAFGSALVNAPTTLRNITTALQFGMTAALTGAEKAALGLGFALASLGAGAVGAKIGVALSKNTTWFNDLTEALGKASTHPAIAGFFQIADKMHDWFSTTAQAAQSAEAQFVRSVQNMAQSMKDKGIVVEKGTMTWEQYSVKLRQVVGDYTKVGTAATGAYTDISFAQAKFMDLQRQSADAVARVTNGLGLQKLSTAEIKALQLEITGLMSKAKDEIDKINAGVKAGKIDKTAQTEMERQYVTLVKDLNTSMVALGGTTRDLGGAMGTLAEKKKSAAVAAKELKESTKAIEAFGFKIRDVLDSLPQSFDAFVSATKKVQDIPKGFEAQWAAFDRLKEKIRDLRMEIERAPSGARAMMQAQLTELEAYASRMEKWLEQVQKRAKFTDELVAGLDQVQASFSKVNVEGLKLPDILAQISAVDFSGIVKPLLTVEEAIKGIGAKTPQMLQDAAAKAKEYYETLRTAAESNTQYYVLSQQALTKWLEAQIEANRVAGQSTTDLEAQLAQARSNMGDLGTAVKANAKEASDFANKLDKQVSLVLNDMASGIADVILGAKSMGEVLEGVLNQMGKAIVRFTVEYWVGQFLKSIKEGVAWMFEADTAAKQLQKTVGTAPTMKTTAPKVPGGETVKTAEGGSGLLKAMGGFMNAVNVISNVISAVTDVLQYLQGRRMEKDIGRIEVTSRGILNQSISIQETLNKYMPAMSEIVSLFHTYLQHFASLMNTTEQMLAVLQNGIPIGGSGEGVPPPASTPGPPASMPGGETPGATEVLEETLEKTGDALEQAADRWSSSPISDLPDLIVDSGTGTEKAAEKTGGVWQTMPIKIDKPIREAGESLSETAADFGDALSDAARTIENTAPAAVGGVVLSGEVVANALEGFSERIQGAVGGMAEFFQSMGAYVSKSVLEMQIEALRKLLGDGPMIPTDPLVRKLADLERQLSGTSYGVGRSGAVTWVPANNLTNNYGSTTTLNLTVNTVDAGTIGNRLIEEWRRRGVDI